MNPKLCLGTAQFGLVYGITNNIGKIEDSELEKILRTALENNIDYIDTAQSYGNAEERLGEAILLKDKFKIVNKFSSNIEKKWDAQVVDIWNKNFFKSLENLKVDYFDSFLIHDIKYLERNDCSILIDWLNYLKQKSFIKRIGVSIYEKKDLENIPIHEFDLVQLPLSIYDQRLLKDGTIKFLYSSGIAVHVRSIFLQGLILQNENSWPNFLSNAFKNHHMINKIKIEKSGLKMLDFALEFIFSCKEIEAILFGVTTNEELKEIIKIWKKLNKEENRLFKNNFNNYEWPNSDEVDPRKWSEAN